MEMYCFTIMYEQASTISGLDAQWQVEKKATFVLKRNTA